MAIDISFFPYFLILQVDKKKITRYEIEMEWYGGLSLARSEL